MREELIRVLKAKLGDVNQKIDSLIEINEKIDEEKNKLDYASRVLDEFKDGDEYNILNFDKLTKEDFERILEIVDNESNKYFDANECSYEGLIYLINGIKNGVSLNLTDEQRVGIEYLVRGIAEKEEEYGAVIDGLSLAKLRYGEEDVENLNSEKDTYIKIVNDFNDKGYINNIDKVCDAINYSGLDSHEIVAMLTYILNYNAEVYELRKNNGKPIINTDSYEKNIGEEEKKEDRSNQLNDRITFKPIDVESYKNNKKYYGEEISNEEIKFDAEDNSKDIEQKEYVEEIPLNNSELYSYDENKVEDTNEDINTINPYINNIDNEEVSFDKTNEEYNEYNYIEEESKQDDLIPPISFEESVIPVEEIETQNVQEEKQDELPHVEEIESNNDFEDIITNSDYDAEEEKTSTRELQRLFGEYNLDNSIIDNELLDGNATSYRLILDTLKKNELLEDISKNRLLLCKILRYSDVEKISEILKIIREDLSVDDDFKVTLKIVLNTMPSIFINNNGNYNNFVNNVKFFKQIGINLISLFDFSKEVFIVDNERVLSNYNIVKDYNIEVDYKNAKYMLVLPDIAERMDYYVESVYEDKIKKETFDGINYINNYAVKLNNVSDLIIKRLRYSSENGKKVFGSKPNSLAGEITNPKVNVLNISDEYLNSFFNNEFDGITTDEVREFAKLVSNSSNVGNYSDELDMLKKYHKLLRYVIGNINISYNKVVRNYNILRSYGINSLKALHFAICYNLVITKDEYQELKKTILELGGNA